MKVSRAQAEENRDRIIDVAGRLFRERGFDGIGIADLMKEAGLTHGGFYGNFSSKDDLISQASERLLSNAEDRWTKTIDRAGGDAFDEIVRTYVSGRHRDATGAGCAFAALAPDAARHGAGVRSAFSAGIRTHIDILTKAMPGRSAAARRKKALSALAEMIGAVVLARATKDDGISDEILEAVVSDLTSARSKPRGTARL